MNAPQDLVAFVAAEQPRLVRACHLLLDDHAVAEEIAQEALVRAASRWEQVRALDSPGGWTHRVALNLATSQLRRARLERRARARIGDDHAHADTSAHVPEALAVRAALQQLPRSQRRVLVLRHVLQWRASEIAELDGVPAASVRKRLTRARTALREELTAAGVVVGEWDEEAADVR